MRPSDSPNLYFSTDGFTVFECPLKGDTPEFFGFMCNLHDLTKVSKHRAEEMLEFIEQL